MDRKVFYICGAGRSGSTLLDLMIGNSPRGLSIGELHALFRPWKPHHLIKPKSCFCDDEKCKFWNEIKKEGEKKVYINIFNKFKGINFIVDSSKSPIWLKDQLKFAKNFNYKIIPIIIFKNPLEYAYSRLKRNNLANWKYTWITTHLQLFYILNDFITVNYQDLARNPIAKIKSLCKQLDIEYFNGKEKYWENHNIRHLLFGSDSVKLSKKEIYYESQFNSGILSLLERKTIFKGKIINDILTILRTYEIDSSANSKQEAFILKEKIKKFNILDIVRMGLTSTHYYWFNRINFGIQKYIQKLLPLNNIYNRTN